MDYRQLIRTMDPEVYQNLKRAVELGKWPNGQQLTEEQRRTSLQAVIAYDHQHKSEQERVGFIRAPEHDHCGGFGEAAEADKPQPLKWK